MVEIYCDLLYLIGFSLLVWGLIHLERIYQYPFFIVVIFISFILPQVRALVDNPGLVSQTALERLLLMTCLCLISCWLGYQFKPNSNWLAKLYIPVDEHKLFNAGLMLMGVGYLCNYLLSVIGIQTTEFGTWSGPATILYFFSQVIYISFSIFLSQLLKRPRFANILCVALSSIPPLNAIIVSGRRQPTMTFLIIIGLSFWLVRRYMPPRWLVIVAIIAMTYLIPLVGQLRGDFWTLVFQQDWQGILSASQQSFERLQGGEILELRNAALVMDAAEQTGQYGWGTGFWDDLIFQYVPGQIVGYDIKQSLQFNWGEYNLSELYGYKTPNGSTLTGIGDSFVEFSYFGCLLFALIGYLFKHLWISSVYLENTIIRLLYVGLISPVMVGITHGVGRFLQEAVFQIIFIILIARYARVPCPKDSMTFNFQQSPIKIQ